MTEDNWLGSIADIKATVAHEDDIPLSVYSAVGLSTEQHLGVDESQNLRLLRVSVAEFRTGEMSTAQYEDNAHRVMDVAQSAWNALQSLPGVYGFEQAAAFHFEQLYDACRLMLDEPSEGLRGAVRAYRALDQLELELREVREQAA